MNIITSIHRKYTEKIFSGEKPFEFRSKLPNDFGIGDIIYIYETSKNKGVKKVIAECKVKNIIKLTNDKGEYSCFGAYHFIDYYFSHIKHQEDIAEKFRTVKEEFKDKFTNYKYGFIINYALSDIELDHIRKTGRPYDTFTEFPNGYQDKRLVKLLNDNEKTYNCIKECDEWLSNIGFYYNYDESYWKYAIELTEIKKYDKPKEISEFIGRNGVALKRPPQSWCYTTSESLQQ